MAFHDSRHSGRSAEVVTPPLTLAWIWKDAIAYDNDPKWKKQAFPWLPVYYRGRLYFQGGMNANRLFALDPASGKVLWEVDNPGYTASGNYLFQFANYPVAVKGRILNASTDFTASMDAVTGGDYRNLYNTNGGWPSGGAALWNQMAILQFVESDDGSEDLRIVTDPAKLTVGGGRSKPDRNITFSDFAFRAPAVDNNVVYANRLGQLVAWDPASGADFWTWGSRNFGASPAVWNRILFFYASSRNTLVAIDTRALAASSYSLAGLPVLWTAPIAGAYAPIASDGVVYTGSSDGNFYALDARTGAMKWKLTTRAAFSAFQIPAISGSLIYIPGADGILYLLDKDTGQEVWRYEGIAAFGPVVIGGGRVFVSDATFALYGFQAAGAALGPVVSGLTVSRLSAGSPSAIGLAGAGFTGATAVQLDDAAQTTLTGFTTPDDQTIAGAAVPAALAPGRYRVSVTTPAGRSVDGPELEVMAAGSFFPSVLGISQGPYDHGTDHPFQRHLVRLKDGTLVAAYAGRLPASGQGDMWQIYQTSRDGGRTWNQPAPFNTGGPGSSVMWAASFGVSVGADDRVQASFQQWPGYRQAFAAYTYDGDWMQPSAGMPVLLTGGPLYPGPVVNEPGGKIWVAYAVRRSQTDPLSDLYSSYSNDGGKTWTQTPKISQTSGATPAMTLLQGLPFLVYTEAATLAWSAWSGSQWSTPRALPGNIGGAGANLSMTATNDGKVHLAAGSTGGATAGLVYLSFNGTEWSSATVLDSGGTSPSLTTNGTELWCFYVTAAKNIVYRHWSRDANAWDAAVAVTNDAAGNARPATLELSPDGAIPVIWTVGMATPFEIHSAAVPVQGAAAALETKVYPAPLLVTGTQVSLVASPAGGSAPYRFAWSAPAGSSLNSTTAGAPTATFTKAGTYRFGLTVQDVAGSSSTVFTDVSVTQAPMAVTVVAPQGPLAVGNKYQFAAVVPDQFGNPVVPAPALTWNSNPPRGVIDSNGNFVAQAAGDFKITAAVPGGVSGSITVTVMPAGSLPLVISGVTHTGITQGAATIRWTTNDASDSQVEYGFTTDYGNASSALNSTMTTDHSVVLTGLTPRSIYHYRVRSKSAAGNTAVSGDFQFTTLGMTRPVGR